jgi:hypothetical protein
MVFLVGGLLIGCLGFVYVKRRGRRKRSQA